MITLVSSRLSYWEVAQLALWAIIGGFTVFSGLQLGIPAAVLLPFNGTIEAMRDLDPGTPHERDGLINAERTALALHSNAADWANLSLAVALRAQESKETNSEDLKEAQEDLKRSLSLAPANPYSWTRLAVIDQSVGVPDDQVLLEWRMAVMTGPNEPRLHRARLQMGLSLWPLLNDSDRTAIFQEIRSAWVQDKPAVIESAKTPFASNVIRAALATNLPDLIAFEKLLRSASKPAQ